MNNNIRMDVFTRERKKRELLNRIVFVKKDQKLYLDNNYNFQGRSIYFSMNSSKAKQKLANDVLKKILQNKQMFDAITYAIIKEKLLIEAGV